MKKLLSNLALFSMVLFAAAMLIEAGLFLQMKDKRAHVLEDWPDLNGVNADILVLGNSRTANHVIPDSLGSEFSAYNLGYNGYRGEMGAHRLAYYLAHNTKPPQLILVQADCSFLGNRGKQANFLMKEGMLRYFFLDQIGINAYFSGYQNWRGADAFVPLLRYKGFPTMFLKHCFGWDRWDRRGRKGFWFEEQKVGQPAVADMQLGCDDLSAVMIDSISDASGIPWVGIIPPTPQGLDRPAQKWLDSIRVHRPVWDFSDLFQGPDTFYFYDHAHFNLEGARIYSSALKDSISQLGLHTAEGADD